MLDGLPKTINRFEQRRAHFLREALDEAVKWCPAPETLVERMVADQFWLRLFSSSSEIVTKEQSYTFLRVFRLARFTQWDTADVAKQIMKFRSRKISEVPAAIDAFANDLTRAITGVKRGKQTSAASKIAFFTRPLLPVFIWDQHAMRSAQFRDRRRNRGGDSLSRSDKFKDYLSHSESCARALEDERGRNDFRAAVREFSRFLKKVEGPMSERKYLPFVERRLLDKLMYCEGRWLEENWK